VKHEFETNIHHERPGSEPYCRGCWRLVIDDEDPTHPTLICNECDAVRLGEFEDIEIGPRSVEIR
jgi:hypothetical protein